MRKDHGALEGLDGTESHLYQCLPEINRDTALCDGDCIGILDGKSDRGAEAAGAH